MDIFVEGERMSLHEYQTSKEISMQDWPFYALIMAAMRQADSENISRLRVAFPWVWDELQSRYWAPNGCITPEEVESTIERYE